ncbi:MAG: phosphoribosylformylglycinamidine synthase II, partial [Rhodospirillales bacterium]|nr:phosphoribosylformylglycinamidine synthase II [Rhodospirillales bacterium]
GQSLWLREIAGREDGAPPPVDLPAERAVGDFVRNQILAGAVRACHDVSDGGILVAIAEMCIASGIGARLATHPRDIPGHAFWFGEDQGRYLVAVPDGAAFIRAAEVANVPAMRIATSGGQDLTLPDGGTISVKALRDAHERFFPAWMDGG